MAFPVIDGREVKLEFANEELNPLDYRAPDGSCTECGQPKITFRHNCDALRLIAARRRIEREAENETKRKNCTHPSSAVRMLSHEEAECTLCGEIWFVPDE